MTIQIFILTIFSVTLSSIAQILLKLGMSNEIVIEAMTTFPSLKAFIAILTSIPALCGLFLYFIGAIVWLKVLTSLDVSIAYPFVGLGFISTMLISFFILGEPISLLKVLGTITIITGIVLLSNG